MALVVASQIRPVRRALALPRVQPVSITLPVQAPVLPVLRAAPLEVFRALPALPLRTECAPRVRLVAQAVSINRRPAL